MIRTLTHFVPSYFITNQLFQHSSYFMIICNIIMFAKLVLKLLQRFSIYLSLSSTSERNDHNSCCSRLGGTSCWLPCTSSVLQSIRSMVQLGSIPEVGKNCPSLHRHCLLSKCPASVFPAFHVDLC